MKSCHQIVLRASHIVLQVTGENTSGHCDQHLCHERMQLCAVCVTYA